MASLLPTSLCRMPSPLAGAGSIEALMLGGSVIVHCQHIPFLLLTALPALAAVEPLALYTMSTIDVTNAERARFCPTPNADGYASGW